MEMDDDGHTTDFAPIRRPAGHDFKYFGYYSLRQRFAVVIGRADSQTNLGTYDTEEEAGRVVGLRARQRVLRTPLTDRTARNGGGDERCHASRRICSHPTSRRTPIFVLRL